MAKIAQDGDFFGTLTEKNIAPTAKAKAFLYGLTESQSNAQVQPNSAYLLASQEMGT
jgi:hypothetical protein